MYLIKLTSQSALEVDGRITGTLDEHKKYFDYLKAGNGKTSGKYYEKYQMKYLGIKPDILPSTSPANAAYSLGKLVEIWKKSIIY